MPEFTRVFRVQGMDSNSVPRFQMVPTDGYRYVILRDGKDMTVTNMVPTVCELTEIKESALPSDEPLPRQAGDRFFKIKGSAKGVSFLIATGGGQFFPLFLEIGVKDVREQLVVFNFLTDSAGHTTTRPSSILGQWVPLLNYIWRRQANVKIINHGVRRPIIGQNLGATITLPAGQLGTTGNAIAAVGDTGVDLNVFFVWKLQETPDTGDVDAVTTVGTAGSGSPGVCIFEDDAGKGQGLSLAHEFGHHMGLTHPGHRKIDLMWDFSGERGFNLTRADVNTANP